MISDKGEETLQWKRDGHFNKWCWIDWTYIYKKRMNIDSTSYAKTKSKYIDLNVKCKAVIFLE